MEIKKSYELRQVGNQLVLRQMAAPDFEMNVVLTADELVLSKDGNELPSRVSNMPFFVLRQGDLFVLCWEKNFQLQTVTQCHDFCIFGETLLIKKEDDIWYWWTSVDGKDQLYELGKKVLSIGPAFMLFDQTDNTFFFMYFEDETNLKSKHCLFYEVLQKKEIYPNSFLNEELFPDVLRLDTKEGSLFVSITKKTGPSYFHMQGETKGNVSYTFTFAATPEQDLIAFTEFINATCVLLCQRGFRVPVGFGGKAFVPATVKEHMKKGDVKISISVGLLHMLDHDVEIELNLTKLYREEPHVYVVKCPDLGYYKTADELRVEKSPTEHALFVTSSGMTDKIFCKGGYTLGQNSLTLMTNV